MGFWAGFGIGFISGLSVLAVFGIIAIGKFFGEIFWK